MTLLDKQILSSGRIPHLICFFRVPWLYEGIDADNSRSLNLVPHRSITNLGFPTPVSSIASGEKKQLLSVIEQTACVHSSFFWPNTDVKNVSQVFIVLFVSYLHPSSSIRHCLKPPWYLQVTTETAISTSMHLNVTIPRMTSYDCTTVFIAQWKLFVG